MTDDTGLDIDEVLFPTCVEIVNNVAFTSCPVSDGFNQPSGVGLYQPN